MPRLLAAPDKFRGTASAAEVASAAARAATAAGWECDEAPVADGGEGILEVLGGAERHTVVRGPLGDDVEAEWRMREDAAVIEMARASGLLLAGGREGNDPMAASTAGTGQLVAAAVTEGARRIIIGMGGSATTDGGQGCLEVLEPHARLRGVQLLVACDVTTTFIDAAEIFAPQKGASAAQVALLKRRLERLAQLYEEQFGVDVRQLPGSGAAGGPHRRPVPFSAAGLAAQLLAFLNGHEQSPRPPTTRARHGRADQLPWPHPEAERPPLVVTCCEIRRYLCLICYIFRLRIA